MEVYFPTELNAAAIRGVRFQDWSNDRHTSELLKCTMMIPDFLFLFKSDNNPPVPAVPFVDLGYFRDREQNQTFEVIIQAGAIQHEISLVDYYTYLAKVSQEEVMQLRLIDNNTEKPDFLVSKRFLDGQTWVTRRTGYKVWMGGGAFVVTLNIACNMNYYYQNADLFYYMLSTFRPVNVPEYALAERLKLFSKRYPVDFASYIPFSWSEMHHHNDTMDEMKAGFTKRFKDRISGGFTVNAVSMRQYPTSEMVLWYYLKEYFDKGLDFNTISLQKASVFDGFDTVADSINFTYYSGGSATQYNLTFYLGNDSNNWLYVEMFGLAKGQDFDAWAINKRTLQLFIENFKTI